MTSLVTNNKIESPSIAIPDTTTASQIPQVFDYIRDIAESPESEFMSRDFYLENKSEPINEKAYILGDEELSLTPCGRTHNVLLSALLGMNNETKMKKLTENLHTISREIQDNGQALKQKDKSDFFTYSFSLSPLVNNNDAIIYAGHQFVAIQYLDEHSQPRYRLFQSYIMQYTLKQYLDKGGRDLTEEEFLSFLKDLEFIISSDKWSAQVNSIYKKHFDVDHGYKLNSSMSKRIPLEVTCGECSVEKVLEKKNEFEALKQSPFFPKVFLSHTKEEQKILMDTIYSRVDESKETVFTQIISSVGPIKKRKNYDSLPSKLK